MEGAGTIMDISIGAEVAGTEGSLGRVHRVIVDARSGAVTDLVVKRGSLFGTDRVVPLGHVTRVENGTVFLDLDQQHFDIMDGFADDRYHAPDPSYSGPPGFERGTFLVDTMVAGGGMGPAAGSPSLGFPGGEQVTPDDLQRPVIAAGSPVLDAAGEKVGEVGQLSLSPENGRPTQLTLRQGTIFHHDTDLPIDWVAELSDKGVMLNVPKSQVEELGQQGRS